MNKHLRYCSLLLSTAVALGTVVVAAPAASTPGRTATAATYVEVAEDGSADRYRVSDNIKVQSWPASTFPGDGVWHVCGMSTEPVDPFCVVVPA